MPVGTSLMSMIIRRKQVLGKIFKGIYMCIFKITFKNIYIKYTLLSYAYEQMREYMRMGIINTICFYFVAIMSLSGLWLPIYLFLFVNCKLALFFPQILLKSFITFSGPVHC